MQYLTILFVFLQHKTAISPYYIDQSIRGSSHAIKKTIMKKTGNICDFALERDAALMAAYRQEIDENNPASLSRIAEGVARRPSSRFWVSEERAVAVVAAMLRGEDVTSGMHPSKRRMYEEIHRRIIAVIARSPGASLVSMVAEVIYTPAPEFYLSPRYIRDRIIIAKSRKEQPCRVRS